MAKERNTCPSRNEVGDEKMTHCVCHRNQSRFKSRWDDYKNGARISPQQQDIESIYIHISPRTTTLKLIEQFAMRLTTLAFIGIFATVAYASPVAMPEPQAQTPPTLADIACSFYNRFGSAPANILVALGISSVSELADLCKLISP